VEWERKEDGSNATQLNKKRPFRKGGEGISFDTNIDSPSPATHTPVIAKRAFPQVTFGVFASGLVGYSTPDNHWN
jgi:hypothetical protein